MKKHYFFIFAILFFISFGRLKVNAAGQPLTVSGYVYSTRIADSTSILSQGIVSQGKPVYEITIKYTITGVTNFSRTVFSVASTGSNNVRIVSSNMFQLNAMGSSGNYSASFYVVYQSWNVTSYVSSVSAIGSSYSGSSTVNVSVPVAASYKSQFYVTGYVTADESQYTGTQSVRANGINNYLYKQAFLDAVRLNGSGYSSHGHYLQYSPSNGQYSIVQAIITASGTIAEAGRTIAAQNTYVPRYYRPDGQVDRAKIYIGNVGFRQAEDNGSAITGFRIDVYLGIGLPASPASWDNTYQTVTYIGNNLY